MGLCDRQALAPPVNGRGILQSRSSVANPVQSFFATDPFAFCPQSDPNAVATADFCDFTSPGSRYQYNRASINAQSSYVLPNFAGTAGYQYEVENGSLPFLAHRTCPPQQSRRIPGFPLLAASARFAKFWSTGRSERLLRNTSGAASRRFANAAAGPRILGRTRLRAFYGQGIKEPRFDQLFDDQFGDLGNPNLKPETSKTWSAGLEQKLWDNRVTLNGEYFSNRFYDIISFAFCSALPPPDTGNSCGLVIPGAPPSFGFFFNTDRARARGTNITARSEDRSLAAACRNLHLRRQSGAGCAERFRSCANSRESTGTAPGEFWNDCRRCGVAQSKCVAVELFQRAAHRQRLSGPWTNAYGGLCAV